MSPTILVIDDEAVVRLMLQRLLKAEHLNVIVAADGREGFDLFRTCAPDLVITDILMPGQEGIETIRRMRHERPDAKIIAMSGGGRIKAQDLLLIAQRMGADGALAKPFGREELLAAIRSVLAVSNDDAPPAYDEGIAC
jgi:DNA-binding response OmpR family regulator